MHLRVSAPAPAVAQGPAVASPTSTRITSIDAFRGLVMFLMLAEAMRLWTLHTAFPESRFWSIVAYNTSHVPWQGCSLHDLIQPAFSFLVGAAMFFAVINCLTVAFGGRVQSLLTVLKLGGIAAVVVGVFLGSGTADWSHLTATGTANSSGASAFGLAMAQLKAGEIAFQDARDRHARETKEAAARLADVHEKYEVRLTQADTAIKVAESKRAEALASLDRVARQSTAERQAANEESRQRQAKFDASFRQEAERRQQVEKDLYHTRMAFEEARLQFVNDLAAATERGIQNEARLEAQAAEDRAAWDRARETAEAEIQHLQKEGDRLHQSLVAAVREIRRGETAQHHVLTCVSSKTRTDRLRPRRPALAAGPLPGITFQRNDLW